MHPQIKYPHLFSSPLSLSILLDIKTTVYVHRIMPKVCSARLPVAYRAAGPDYLYRHYQNHQKRRRHRKSLAVSYTASTYNSIAQEFSKLRTFSTRVKTAYIPTHYHIGFCILVAGVICQVIHGSVFRRNGHIRRCRFSSVRSHSRFSGTIILLSFAVSCCTAVVIHLDVSRFEERLHSSIHPLELKWCIYASIVIVSAVPNSKWRNTV
jgi:hypothetical protein